MEWNTLKFGRNDLIMLKKNMSVIVKTKYYNFVIKLLVLKKMHCIENIDSI